MTKINLEINLEEIAEFQLTEKQRVDMLINIAVNNTEGKEYMRLVTHFINDYRSFALEEEKSKKITDAYDIVLKDILSVG